MKVGRVFLSGCAVYVIVAACSAIDPAGQRGATSGRGDGGTAAMASGAAGADGSGGLGGRPDVGVGGSGATGGSGVSGGSSGTIMDPVPPANADPISGTRLKALYVEGSDGSKAYALGWHDVDLGVDCVQMTTADGRSRCVPWVGLGTSNQYFSDPSCAAAVALGTCGYAYGDYVHMTHNSDAECPYAAVLRVFRRGPQISTVYALRSGVCEAAALPTGFIAYAIGTEVPPSSFVELTMRHD